MLIAHASHWLVSLAYLAPVVGFLVWLGMATYKERQTGSQNDRARGRKGGDLS